MGTVAGATGPGCVGGGSAFINPGSRKVAGEMLCEVLMPLHPAAASKAAPQIAKCRIFQFIFTKYQYKPVYSLGNCEFPKKSGCRP